MTHGHNAGQALHHRPLKTDLPKAPSPSLHSPGIFPNLLIMRLTTKQIDLIRQLATQLAGEHAQIRVFGSRLDDTAKGGDLDLLLEIPEPVENPARLAASISAKVSRIMHGRKVDVLISAPNLKKLPIHEIGHKEGKLL